VGNYFDSIGYPFPINNNPAEYLLDLVSTDFAHDEEVGTHGEKNEQGSSVHAIVRLKSIQNCWQESSQVEPILSPATKSVNENHALVKNLSSEGVSNARPSLHRIVFSLLHRSFIKSNRDVVAYGIRIAMYLGKLITLNHFISR
jgi:hypothetical protein